MSRKNYDNEDQVIGYHKQEKFSGYDDPIDLKNKLKEEINKSYPGLSYKLVLDKDSTIYCYVEDVDEDSQLAADNIDDLVDSNYSDLDIVIIVKLVDSDDFSEI